MDDKKSVIKRQVERGNIIDDEARDIYRIAILVVSIIVAAAAINFDIANLIQTMLYDTGVALSTDDTSLLANMIALLGFWALLPTLAIVVFIAIVFSLSFAVMVWLFFVPPYYAVRAQASAPISSNDHTFELISRDIIMFFNTYRRHKYVPRRIRIDAEDNSEQRIISEIEKEFEEYDGLEDLIEHNKEVLSNKSENLSRAKHGTQRFFISIILFSSVIIMMIYV